MCGGQYLRFFLVMMTEEAVFQQVREIVARELPHSFIVDIALHRSKRSIFQILVDTDTGITMDECVLLTRRIGHWLDENNAFDFPYRMEVSSPGVDKPLKLPRQYPRNIGRTIKVQRLDGTDLSGALVSASETGIVIQPPAPVTRKKDQVQQPDPVQIEFSEIKEAKIQISFK